MNSESFDKSEELTRALLLQINSICNEFEAAWATGIPSLTDFLATTNDAELRLPLLCSLIELDIEYRIARRLPVSSDDYRASFPSLREDWLQSAIRGASIDDQTEFLSGISGVSSGRQKPTPQLSGIELLERVRNSGLLSDKQLQTSVLQQVDVTTATDDDVGRLLLESAHLTPFQLESIRRSPLDPLILGDYVLLDQIGQGGMGTVYRAVHRRMDRTVALKVLRRDVVHSDDMARRFLREVRVAAQLSHPHIVTAYDAGEQHGLSYLVCEFIEGQNLSDIVKQHGPLSLPDSVDIIAQVVTGLEYAHGKSIIHRDIKPSNILLDDDGNAKLLDVGLARVSGSAADSGLSSDLTTTGLVMGTVDFMAPEQAMNSRLADHRSDIYSIGCTLCFLLTGRPPFAGGTSVERLLAHRDNPVPRLTDLDKRVPRLLQQLLEQCMAKDPEDRFQSAAELAAALQNLVRGDLPDFSLSIEEETAPSPTVMATQPGLSDKSAEADEPFIPAAAPTVAITPLVRTAQESGPDAAGMNTGTSRASGSRNSRSVISLCLISLVTVMAVIAASGWPTWFGGNGAIDGTPDSIDLTDLSVAEVQAYRDNWGRALPDGSEIELLSIRFTLIPPGQSSFAGGQKFDRPLYMATTEMTVAQFRSFVEATGYTVESRTVGGFGFVADPPQWVREVQYGWDNLNELTVTDRMPATSISWNDAAAFCAWASQTTGRTIRLPVEAEWEYASRCGRQGRWCFGDDESVFPDYGWSRTEAGLRIHEVGRKRPNAWGLYDMHGNEWEWCDSAQVSGDNTAVQRGGGFHDDLYDCSHVARQERPKSDTLNGAFRVVLEVD